MSVRTLSAAQNSAGLRARRRKQRRRALIALAILLLILAGAAFYALWQPYFRISHIEVFGADQSLSLLAEGAMKGSYFGIIPRNSTFFLPQKHVRAAILDAHSDIAAVSIFRHGFSGLTIKTDDRTPIARWCGLSPTPDVDEYCYVFDGNGFIYAAAATSTMVVNPFKVYAPLEGIGLEPLDSTIANADEFPSMFDFARQLGTLGSPVVSIVVRDSEVDDYLASGTRITHLLGDEQGAFTALVSAKSNINLADGSLEYVDLRFSGKIYLKKVDTAKKTVNSQ